MNRQRLVASLGAVIGIAGIAFVAAKLYSGRDEFIEALRQSDPAWLIAAGVAGLTAILGIGVVWIAIVRARDAVAPAGAGMRWFCVGQLGKYVPGGIWPVVGQGELAHRGGVGRTDAYAGTAVSMLSTLAGAATVAVVAGFASPDDRWVPALLLGLGLVVGLAVLGLDPLRRRAAAVTASLSRGRLTLPSALSFTRWTLFHVPVWLAFSAANLFAIIALNGPHGVGFTVDLVFVTCVAWMAGFVIVGLPGGIGVREAVFVSLMTPTLGAGLAVTVAVVARFVSILVDLVAAGGSVVVARRVDDRRAAA
ncbi:lysylphosphatidylglycerol synthase domain-containing protein [Ilumatobacter nonamiensis]|uniref:lysylphosphatidylglycerol synthase domain-containing protein n=1 Tax=Ilumatobacter nonamiensis TaxID=467093 RepID=UPI0003457C29|nr:lysylphosphatidylglycerol synthase domain-containing protein [Ilumatobacter nonamiensis]